MSRLTRYGWFVLFFNVGVIVLGALVRATGSGAGCGQSWPTCEGAVVPELSGDTAIEYLHRSAVGVALVLVLILVVAIWRARPAGDPARTGAVISVLAFIGEALIGAMIVLYRWVSDDDSVARAVAVPLHLVNTLLLLAALTLTTFWISGGRRLDPRSNRSLWRWLWLGAVAIALISATGAVTALADTLFPKDGIGFSVDKGAHFLTRLRIIHPILAVLAAVIAWWKVGNRTASKGAALVVWLVGAMLVTGLVNIALGVPIWMQLLHLVLADGLWIAYVLMSARALESDLVSTPDPLVAE